MATIVTGEQYRKLDGQLHEIKRQLRQREGYPYNPEHLKLALQAAIEGRFGNNTVLYIDRSRPFNPAKFIGEGWSIVEQDERSLALSEVNLADICLETMLEDGENSVQGKEKLRRLKKSGHIRLDAKVFQTLWENKNLIPESWKGKYIYFDGTVLRRPGGRRCVLCLCWGGGEWRWDCGWLGDGWDVGGPSAVLAEQLSTLGLSS